MCEPVSITMGVMAAAGAATSIMGQQQQKKAAESYENEKTRAVDYQISENRKRATDDYINQVRLEHAQQRQEQEAVVEKSGDLHRQGTAAAATATASAAERGIAGGRTIDQVVSDFRFQEDFEIGRLRENQKLKDQQHAERIKQYGTEYTNRASSVQPYQKKPIQPVDYFSPIFKAVGQTATGMVSSGAMGSLFSSPAEVATSPTGGYRTDTLDG